MSVCYCVPGVAPSCYRFANLVSLTLANALARLRHALRVKPSFCCRAAGSPCLISVASLPAAIGDLKLLLCNLPFDPYFADRKSLL